MMQGNNIGNIRRSPSFTWEGEIRPVPYQNGFAQFTSLVYGYRAMIKILLHYMSTGTDTITKMLNRYAPPVENNTQSYINYISSNTGIKPDAVIQAPQLVSIVYWMGNFEQGYQAGDLASVAQAYNMIVEQVAQTPQSETNYAGIGLLATLALITAAYKMYK